MRVPLIDLSNQDKDLRDEILEAVSRTLDSGVYILGPRVKELEENLSGKYDIRHAIGTSSGTDSLLLSLMALGTGPGDIVITTSYSFISSAEVIARTGATPVFVDVDENTFNLSPGNLAEWFRANPHDIKRVRAVIPVHLFGQCAPMNEITEIAGEYHIPVIEDAAQALGASFPAKNQQNSFAGTTGLCGCVSFFPAKNLGGAGDGGMIFTNHDKLAEKIRSLRSHGMETRGICSFVGGNCRLDEIQAAILLVKLRHIEKWQRMRQEAAAFYDVNLPREFVTPPVIAWERQHHVYNQYVIKAGPKRDLLKKHLEEKEIQTAIYYSLPLHLQPCFCHFEKKEGAFTVSEKLSRECLALPIAPPLTREQQAFVIESLIDFYRSAI